MDEQTISSEARLEQINSERKSLKEKISSERETRLKEAAEMRANRDEKIEKIQRKLSDILKAIFNYNKLGKVAKMDYNIFGKIQEEINCPDEKVFVDAGINTTEKAEKVAEELSESN